jgi:hypothetical protein
MKRGGRRRHGWAEAGPEQNGDLAFALTEQHRRRHEVVGALDLSLVHTQEDGRIKAGRPAHLHPA